MNKVIISVDAGGSSTRTAIIDYEKNILDVFKTGSGSPAVLNDEHLAFANIDEGLEKAYKKVKPELIVMGVSGIESVADREKYVDYFQNKYNAKVLIENDAVIAVYSIVTDKYNEGILVLSGTGSAVMGIKDTKTRLIGGWGHILTEVGSAFTTVRDFFKSLILNYELGKELTDLGKEFFKRYNLNRMEDIKLCVYPKTKKDIAKYASFITEFADKGNPDAIALLKQGARDLARDVKNAYKALNLSSDAVIGFRGGFVANAPILREELILILSENGYNPRVVKGDENPLYGGYYLAKRKGLIC
ncbi:MAG TPA: hypothetical protein GXZ48_00715 [Acholeplasmataceae bacterium]|jgi:glucosamine kinase|nr:hypothetical protein [Acholeplasmataceae bacterium]